MEARELVGITLANMSRIYEDVAEVMQVVEQKCKGRSLQPIGYSGVTWEVSTSLEAPRSWMYRYFARAYERLDRPKTIAGFCIHLGQYDPGWIAETVVPLTFPFMTVSRLDLDARPTSLVRPDVLNNLWTAGWHRDFRVTGVHASRLLRGTIAYKGSPEVSASTFFLDLLQLTSADVVERAVVQPLLGLIDGDESLVGDRTRQIMDVEPKTSGRL